MSEYSRTEDMLTDEQQYELARENLKLEIDSIDRAIKQENCNPEPDKSYINHLEETKNHFVAEIQMLDMDWEDKKNGSLCRD